MTRVLGVRRQAPRPVSSAGSSGLLVRQQAIASLRAAILSFQLRPGDRLVERELVEQFGVSRTTIREALRELAAEGLVTVVPQKGARVCAPSLEDAGDLYEARAVLESMLVRRFVDRASDEEVRELVAVVDNYEAVTRRTTDPIELLAAKDKFYEVLIRGARSSTFKQLLEGIKARVQALRATSLSVPGRAAETVVELKAITVAAVDRDAPLAAKLCADHVRAAGRNALMRLAEAEEASSA